MSLRTLLWAISFLAIILSLLGNFDISYPFSPVEKFVARSLINTNAKEIGVHASGLVLRYALRFANQFRNPSYTGEESVPGIHAPVRIVHDDHGLPHIFASNDDDLFFTQGFVHGRERLFQMTLGVLAAEGRLSEFLGDVTIEVDRLLRVIGSKRLGDHDAQRCGTILERFKSRENIRFDALNLNDPLFKLNVDSIIKESNQSNEQGQVQLSPETQAEIVEYVQQEWYSCSTMHQYVRGINHFVSIAKKGGWRRDMPLEMLILGMSPFEFTTNDFYAFTRLLGFQMNFGWEGEITQSILESLVGTEALKELLWDQTWDASAADGLGHSILPKGMEKMVYGQQKDGIEATIGRFVPKPSGSNWMVVSGNLTESGHAILGNDPHLPVTTPAFWFLNGLHNGRGENNDDSIDAVGLSVPGIPGLVVGRSQRISSGVTLSFADTGDVFLERVKIVNDDNDDNEGEMMYEHRGSWKPVHTYREVIKVKGKPDVVEIVKETIHGPIISATFKMDMSQYRIHQVELQHSQDEQQSRSAVQYVLSHSNTAFIRNVPTNAFSAVNILRAQSVSDAERFFRRLVYPALSLGFADADGNIGYRSAGRVPLRSEHAPGHRVSPGWTGEHDWEEYFEPSEMPHSINPEQGYLVSCNNNPINPINDDSKLKSRFGRTYMSGKRCFRAAQMIEEILDAGKRFTMADFATMQLDTYAHSAEVTVNLVIDEADLGHFHDADQDVKLGIDILREWAKQTSSTGNRFRIDRESVGTTVYEIFKLKALRNLMLAGVDGDGTLASLLMGRTPFLLKDAYPQPLSLRSETLHYILSNPESYWLKKAGRKTEVIKAAMKQTIQELRNQLGANPESWTWGRIHRAKCDHALSAVPVLHHVFSTSIEMDGDDTTVAQAGWLEDVNESGFFPSMRTVHEMQNHQNPKSTFVLPPGNSGNLGSPFYEDGSVIYANREQVPLLLGNEAYLNSTTENLTLVLCLVPQ